MRLLHTSDWHIGHYFFGYDRKTEHIFFFDWLKRVIKEQQIDALLVAGDIFDSPNPSAISQRIYYKFLKEATTENPHLQIIIIAGNHDSAARLEAPLPLLEEMNVFIKGTICKNTAGEIDYQSLFIPLTCREKTEAWCITVPYLRQGDYPNAESYSQGVKKMYEVLYQEVQKIKGENQPIIVMGHLQATGSEISENDRSERTIVGGLECVSPEVFDKTDIVYTALGHLHKGQRVSKRENVRYAGSPLPMSFSEKYYKQGVNLVELVNGQLERIERIHFDPPVKLISLPPDPKPLNEVLKELMILAEGETTAQSPYLEIKVLITEPEPSMRHQIEEALRNKAVRLTSAVPYRQRKEHTTESITYEELKNMEPIEMAKDIFSRKYGNEMPEKMASLLMQVIQEVGK